MPTETYLKIPFECFIGTRLGSNQYNRTPYQQTLHLRFQKMLDIKEEPFINRLTKHSDFSTYTLYLDFYLGEQDCDVDNLCKMTIDVLKFYMGSDDLAIYRLVATKYRRKKNPGVRIRIKERK